MSRHVKNICTYFKKNIFVSKIGNAFLFKQIKNRSVFEFWKSIFFKLSDFKEIIVDILNLYIFEEYCSFELVLWAMGARISVKVRNLRGKIAILIL